MMQNRCESCGEQATRVTGDDVPVCAACFADLQASDDAELAREPLKKKLLLRCDNRMVHVGTGWASSPYSCNQCPVCLAADAIERLTAYLDDCATQLRALARSPTDEGLIAGANVRANAAFSYLSLLSRLSGGASAAAIRALSEDPS